MATPIIKALRKETLVSSPGGDAGKKTFRDPAPPREPEPLSPRQIRKLQLHQETFAADLAARLSLFLRTEFSLALAGVHTAPYQQMTESWPEPAHLTLFKTEPLRGVSILEIPIHLGMCIVDRLMGGPGEAQADRSELSAIESALLEQVAQIVTQEWCGHCAHLKELKPVILGYENNARFLQTAPPHSTMLVVVLDAALGDCRQQIQIGFPFAALEPLIRQLSQSSEIDGEEPVSPVAPAPGVQRWNPCFDDLCVPVTAEWPGLEVAARDVLKLKVGDVLRIDAKSAQHVVVRVAETGKFKARLGAVAGNWAVELIEIVKH
jgi:flagellar motor switch protein FliM